MSWQKLYKIFSLGIMLEERYCNKMNVKIYYNKSKILIFMKFEKLENIFMVEDIKE